MTLAMSWDEWATCDALALAELVRAKKVKPAELSAQAALAIEKTNPKLSAVVEVSLTKPGLRGPYKKR